MTITMSKSYNWEWAKKNSMQKVAKMFMRILSRLARKPQNAQEVALKMINYSWHTACTVLQRGGVKLAEETNL